MKVKSRDIFLKFLERFIAPVARFCLRRGIKFRSFSEMAKRAFVTAAQEELLKNEQKSSVSRIAVMTGLQRRDVMRLESDTPAELGKLNFVIKIIGHWQTLPQYRTKKGTPRLLSYEGSDSEFAELVSSVSQDLNPYTVLFEMERLGAVAKKSRGLQLLVKALEPSKDIEDGLSLLAGDAEDLVNAVEENLFAQPNPPNLHIHTYYDNVCVEFLPNIREWFLSTGARFHAEARKYLSQFDKDLNPKLYDKEGGARISVASFSLTSPPKTETDQLSGKSRVKKKKGRKNANE